MSEEKKTKRQKVKVVMGAGSFGAETGPGSTFLTVEESLQAVKLCKEYGVSEFDTARIYSKGISEVVLADAVRAVFPKGSSPTPVIATKANPFLPGGLSAKSVENQLNESLKALKSDSVDIFYLHAPDSKVTLEETLAGVNKLYREKKFKEFGLSNFHPFQVAQVYYISKANGYVLPTVYQGLYNLLVREPELELFPALRQFKIRFYAYSPLAGGLLLGKQKLEEKPETGRFAFDLYRNLFWKKSLFDEVEVLRKLSDQYKISMADISMRWILHHSALSEEHGDAVILGASKLTHVKPNLELAKGDPLPDDLVKEIENIWSRLKSGVNEFKPIQPSAL